MCQTLGTAYLCFKRTVATILKISTIQKTIVLINNKELQALYPAYNSTTDTQTLVDHNKCIT